MCIIDKKGNTQEVEPIDSCFQKSCENLDACRAAPLEFIEIKTPAAWQHIPVGRSQQQPGWNG